MTEQELKIKAMELAISVVKNSATPLTETGLKSYATSIYNFIK